MKIKLFGLGFFLVVVFFILKHPQDRQYLIPAFGIGLILFAILEYIWVKSEGWLAGLMGNYVLAPRIKEPQPKPQTHPQPDLEPIPEKKEVPVIPPETQAGKKYNFTAEDLMVMIHDELEKKKK